MAGKRKDNRGIVLQKGESQDAKTGRYRYRYYDNEGITHDIYSWRLRPEDNTPDGKKHTESLREMEKQVHKDLDNGLRAWKANTTLNALIIEYIQMQKGYWAIGTLNGYEYSFEKHIKPKFGLKKVSKLTSDDIEKFYISLLRDKEHPLKISSIATLDKLLRPALQVAVKKKILGTNPADGVIGQLKKKCVEDKPEMKHALEEKQQEKLLEYIKDNYIYSRYYPLFYVLSWTGCRINELLALTWQDIDFQNEIIHVRRSLSYKKVDGKYQFMVKRPKTKQGIREIPMLGNVKQILLDIKAGKSTSKVVILKLDKEVSADDLTQFVFRNGDGKLYDYSSIDYKLKCIIRRYNDEHKEKMPDISCHTFRHSFCCWLCENIEGVNAADDIKYIQSILGHADASTTLNIYSELRKGNQTGKHEALKKKSIGR